MSQIRQKNQGGKGLAVAGIVLGGVGILGAILTFATIAAVDEGIDEIDDELDRQANAPVHAEASPRVCYTVTLTEGSFFRGGTGQSQRDGCDISTFPLGTGSGRNAVVSGKFDSAPGRITAWLSVNGQDQPRQTTDAPSSGFITLSP